MPEEGAASNSNRRRREVVLIVGIGACALAVGIVAYDPNALLLLLVIVASGYLLHRLASWLTEVDLVIPFIAAIGCLALVLWWFVPESFNLGARFDELAPAPVKRIVAPLGRLVSSGGGAAPDGGGGVTNATASASPQADAKSGVEASSGASSSALGQFLAGDSAARRGARGPAVTLAPSRRVFRADEPLALTVFVGSARQNGRVDCGQVQLFDGPSRVADALLTATRNGCTATIATSSLGIGDHTLTARYKQSGSAGTASTSVGITVLPPRK